MLPTAQHILDDQLSILDRVVNPLRSDPELRRLRSGDPAAAPGPILTEMLELRFVAMTSRYQPVAATPSRSGHSLPVRSLIVPAWTGAR